MGVNNHICRECGKPLDGMRKTAVFCSPAHRKDWNNRRMVRGAEMYDVFMALRFERAKATEQQAWTVISSLARAYWDADKDRRQGRKSWDLNEALARLPLAYSNQGDKR